MSCSEVSEPSCGDMLLHHALGFNCHPHEHTVAACDTINTVIVFGCVFMEVYLQ